MLDIAPSVRYCPCRTSAKETHVMPGQIFSDRDPLGGLFGYADGTQGHADRPASIERAESEADDGTAADRSLSILNLLVSEPFGLTWGEVADRLNLHHGQASGALSNLHKAGRVFMLRTKRGKAHPYVHADHRHIYEEDLRYDSPAQSRAGKKREAERAVLDAIAAQYGRGWQINDPYIHSLILQLHDMKEGSK